MSPAKPSRCARTALNAGDPVFQGDVVETGDGAAINLLFVDETTFALGDQARLALDEMVYNPASKQGSSAFSILKGVFVFTSGQIAQTDNTKMTVTTPVATIGIRGTKVAGEVAPPGQESRFTVIDGEIAVVTGDGVVLDAVQSTDSITLVGKAVTHQGSGSADRLTGGAGDDVFSAGGGDDAIVSGGGPI